MQVDKNIDKSTFLLMENIIMCDLYPFIMGEIVVISAHKISVFGGNVNVRSFLSIVLCFDNYNIQNVFIFILYLKFHQKF